MTNKELSALCVHYLLRTDDTSGPTLGQLYLDFQEDGMTAEHMADEGLRLDLLEVALSFGEEYNDNLTENTACLN